MSSTACDIRARTRSAGQRVVAVLEAAGLRVNAPRGRTVQVLARTETFIEVTVHDMIEPDPTPLPWAGTDRTDEQVIALVAKALEAVWVEFTALSPLWLRVTRVPC